MSERSFASPGFARLGYESKAEAQIRKYGRVLPRRERGKGSRSKYDGKGNLMRTKYGEGRR